MLEDFLKLLAGETPESVIWTADLSYWISGRQHDGTADPAWETEEGYLQLHRDLGVMPYYYYEKLWVAEAVYDDTVRSGQENQGDRVIRTLETPIGSLREESVFLPDSACYGVVKHMAPCNLDDYPQRRELWARYDGLPCLGLPRSPLPALAYEWAGLQNMVMLMYDCKDRVRQALALMAKQEAPILDAVCELAPPLVHFPDNLSSDNLTGYYDEHMRERHQQRLQQLHAVGAKAAVHLDGSVRGLLPKLIDVGFDAIEALTPQPAGDLTVNEMAEIPGSADVILWGGAPGVMFASPYTWEELRRHVDHVLETWSKRPFVLGVADQVPPDGDIEFCHKIHDMLGGK
jgi:hypothetical protein